MPQVTVYVRKKDLTIWKDLKDKSEWLSKHLNAILDKELENGESNEQEEIHTTDVVIKPSLEIVYTNEDTVNTEVKPARINQLDLSSLLASRKIKTCKHNYSVGLCKFGCKR